MALPLAPRVVVDPIDVNSVVAYNLRAMRERRRWTQIDVSDRLAELTGRHLRQATISAMERSFDGPRRCLFDAHELYLLSVVFDVPIVYFFLPPSDVEATVADTGRPVVELVTALLGRDVQQTSVDQRLAEIAARNPDGATRVLATVSGVDPADADHFLVQFRAWRERRLAQLEGEYGPRLAAAAEFLSKFVAAVKATRTAAFVETVDPSGPASQP
ncbi:MAG: helix-turn-helix domain-containing protein [Actinomycetota bacterium]|nr:helix-turn-helix domain-containing protein [Actinomycetota bacterium]